MIERSCDIKPIDNKASTSTFSKAEVARQISGSVAKIKSGKPGFESYDFGYLHLNAVCSTNRLRGVVETGVFEEILRENDVDVMCKICPHYLASS